MSTTDTELRAIASVSASLCAPSLIVAPEMYFRWRSETLIATCSTESSAWSSRVTARDFILVRGALVCGSFDESEKEKKNVFVFVSVTVCIISLWGWL